MISWCYKHGYYTATTAVGCPHCVAGTINGSATESNPTMLDNQRLVNENKSLRSQVGTREEMIADLGTELIEKDTEIERLKQDPITLLAQNIRFYAALEQLNNLYPDHPIITKVLEGIKK